MLKKKAFLFCFFFAASMRHGPLKRNGRSPKLMSVIGLKALHFKRTAVFCRHTPSSAPAV